MGQVLKTYKQVMTNPYSPSHIGIDLVGNNGQMNVTDYIIAIEQGTVIEVVSNKNYTNDKAQYGDYGNYVLIDHGNGYKTRYAHLAYNTVTVKVGNKVTKGQTLGYMGNTGYAFGAHLHFEIILNGKTIDPYDYIFGNKVIPTTPTTNIKVGDIVIVNGVGKASSDGTGANTINYINKKMMVIKIKEGTKYPYACNQYATKGDITAWFNNVKKQ